MNIYIYIVQILILLISLLITYLVLSIHIIITHLYANLLFPDFDAYNNKRKRAASRSVYASNNLGSELNSNNRKPATEPNKSDVGQLAFVHKYQTELSKHISLS